MWYLSSIILEQRRSQKCHPQSIFSVVNHIIIDDSLSKRRPSSDHIWNLEIIVSKLINTQLRPIVSIENRDEFLKTQNTGISLDLSTGSALALKRDDREYLKFSIRTLTEILVFVSKKASVYSRLSPH